jgi:hypothetical protein
VKVHITVRRSKEGVYFVESSGYKAISKDLEVAVKDVQDCVRRTFPNDNIEFDSEESETSCTT